MSRSADPEVRQIMAAQDTLFSSRRNALSSQVAILRQRIGQLQSEAGSYSAQLSSVASQERLLDEEVGGVKELLSKGLERKARLLALQRQLAAAGGQRGALNANIARTRQGMAETDSQIAFVRRQQLTEIASDQRNVEMQLADLRQQLTASKDVTQRRALTAPVDGTVVNLRKVTLGGVIGSGETVMEIVPSNETIVIMARIKPNDIDVVHPGLPAEARLTPYKARVMPLVRGTVEMVSADAKYEEATGTVYYEAEMRMDARQLAGIPGVRLIPRMPAEVFIKLGDRSMFSYLVQPLVDSFHRAWREP
jgi:HlyD family secretion protein